MKKSLAFLMSFALIGLQTLAPSSAAAMSMSITPKIWSSVENFNAFDNAFISDSNTGTQVAIREQVNLPLFGLAMSLTPSDDLPLDLMFNFYGGSTEGNFIQVVRDSGNLGSTIKGTYEADRTDVEFLLRYRPKDKTINAFTGLRVNSFEDTLKIESSVGNLTNPIWTGTGTKIFKQQTTIVLWELGVGFFAPVSDDGRHRFFGNTTFGIGSFERKLKNASSTAFEGKIDGGAVAWDVNTGYEWMFSDHFSVNARYRMYAKPTSPIDERYDFTVIHGPDFGLTARF